MYWTSVAEQLVGHKDVDWARSKGDRRLTSTYAFSLGSEAIAWYNRKQPTVALSSSEAEYKGADFATCEAMWLKQLLKEPHVEVVDPTKI